jgi:diguanylate cyclase (GGDEF)-like protein
MVAENTMRRLLDLLLTTDAAQRTRLLQAAMVTAALAALALALLLLALAGQASLRPVLWWALLAPGGALLLFALVRSGWTRRFEDPALTLPQMVGGSAACALAYGLAGAARGGVFLVLMGLLLAALLSATPRQMRQGCIAAAVLLALAMIDAALQDGGWPWVEAVHLLLLAALLPAAPLLASRWAQMRARSQRQQQDLEAALVRIRELATRDELTGLVNRRQMRELMGQEHQRCIRSGRTFCLGVLDIDHFRAVNDRHGRSVGDAVLRSVAHEALRRVRVSDAFARWGGDRFVLLLADARAPLAKGGLERVRGGIGNMHVAVAAGELRVTLSAGLAEHHAGETVEQTLDRAERALAEAKQQGRDRLACLG